MKEISEEYQWKIFELLEGNLSDSERNELEREINNNESLNHYYQTLKLTYLEPQEIQFPNKRRLLKKSTFTIFKNVYFQYSAAAILLMIGGYFIFSQKTNQSALHIKKAVATIQSTHRIKPEIETAKSVLNKTHRLVSAYTPKSITEQIKPLVSFRGKAFKPSTKLIDENQFLNQLVDNQYLSNSEKKQMMLKWLLINSNNQEVEVSKNIEVSEIVTEVKLVEQPLLSAEELETAELNEIWVKEAKEMLKKGQFPRIKFVTSKKEKKWLPSVGIEIQTETSSMVNQIFK
jgi:hypothetical protein